MHDRAYDTVVKVLSLLAGLGLDSCNVLGRGLIVCQYQHVTHLDMYRPAGSKDVAQWRNKPATTHVVMLR
jgi:hypothetical protein